MNNEDKKREVEFDGELMDAGAWEREYKKLLLLR